MFDEGCDEVAQESAAVGGGAGEMAVSDEAACHGCCIEGGGWCRYGVKWEMGIGWGGESGAESAGVMFELDFNS